jgi:hypothetical protein
MNNIQENTIIVRIGGIHEVEGEDCYAAVSGFFKQELVVDIKDSDIDRAHRVGRKGYILLVR